MDIKSFLISMKERETITTKIRDCEAVIMKKEYQTPIATPMKIGTNLIPAMVLGSALSGLTGMAAVGAAAGAAAGYAVGRSIKTALEIRVDQSEVGFLKKVST